jgi:hypothetical protein
VNVLKLLLGTPRNEGLAVIKGFVEGGVLILALGAIWSALT